MEDAMVLDANLLDKAKDAGARFAESEKQALLSRADYHTAVRRLHLAGGSLREIAQALSVSHQRVQQIVDGAGGSWWRLVWRRRNATRDAVCTWCGRSPSEVSKLIAGPTVYICDDCVASAERAMSGAAAAHEMVKQPDAGPRGRCSFCSKRRMDKRPIVAAPAGNICGPCLRICREILDGRGDGKAAPASPPR
jgi:hypothetical protein